MRYAIQMMTILALVFSMSLSMAQESQKEPDLPAIKAILKKCIEEKEGCSVTAFENAGLDDYEDFVPVLKDKEVIRNKYYLSNLSRYMKGGFLRKTPPKSVIKRVQQLTIQGNYPDFIRFLFRRASLKENLRFMNKYAKKMKGKLVGLSLKYIGKNQDDVQNENLIKSAKQALLKLLKRGKKYEAYPRLYLPGISLAINSNKPPFSDSAVAKGFIDLAMIGIDESRAIMDTHIGPYWILDKFVEKQDPYLKKNLINIAKDKPEVFQKLLIASLYWYQYGYKIFESDKWNQVTPKVANEIGLKGFLSEHKNNTDKLKEVFAKYQKAEYKRMVKKYKNNEDDK